MANTIQFKRRVSGAAGSPSALKSGEVAHNEVDDTLYVGKGDDGAGNATSVVPLAGKGSFADLTSTQTIGGAKTFSTVPKSSQDASGSTDLVRKSQFDTGLATKAAATHSHAISDVTGLQTALDGKAASAHTHGISDVTGLQTALDAKAPLASPALSGTPTAPTAASGNNTTQIATTAFVQAAIGSFGAGDMAKSVYDTDNDGKVDAAEVADAVPWTGITGRPATFPPSAHAHAIADVTGLQAALDAKASASALATVATSGSYDDLLDAPPAFSGIVSPLSFGAPSDGVSPASLGIQAAIDAVASRGATGVVWFDRPYAIDTSLVLPPGVILKGNASYNRRDFPNTFNGVRLYPHASAPDGISLLNVGGVGTMSSNPNGGYIDGLAFDGRLYNGDHKTGCVGMTIRDTSDFRIFNTYFGGFDRTNNTGICVLVEGTGEGNCFGTTFAQCIFSNSQHGVIYTGLGTTDMRHSNNLYVGVTRALSIGYDDRAPGSPVQLGGAGMQIVNDHFTYTGMPTAGWYIRNGGQGGSLMVANTYFDQHGTGTPIRLGGSKTKIIGSHFLCAKSQNSPGLIRVMSGGSQQTIVANCTVDLNECALQSLVYYSAKEGTPTGGVITGNMAYGTGASYLGAAIDSTGTLLPDAATASWVNNNNVRCT